MIHEIEINHHHWIVVVVAGGCGNVVLVVLEWFVLVRMGMQPINTNPPHGIFLIIMTIIHELGFSWPCQACTLRHLILSCNKSHMGILLIMRDQHFQAWDYHHPTSHDHPMSPWYGPTYLVGHPGHASQRWSLPRWQLLRAVPVLQQLPPQQPGAFRVPRGGRGAGTGGGRGEESPGDGRRRMVG